MPTTFRLLFRLVLLALLGAAAVYALATLVEPTPEPLAITIPADRFR